jgi:hypothetical protein
MIYNYDGQRKMWKILRSLDRPVSIMAAGGGLFHEFLAHDVLDGTVSGSWNYGLEPMLQHIEAIYLFGLFPSAPALQSSRVAARPDSELSDAPSDAGAETGGNRNDFPSSDCRLRLSGQSTALRHYGI